MLLSSFSISSFLPLPLLLLCPCLRKLLHSSIKKKEALICFGSCIWIPGRVHECTWFAPGQTLHLSSRSVSTCGDQLRKMFVSMEEEWRRTWVRSVGWDLRDLSRSFHLKSYAEKSPGPGKPGLLSHFCHNLAMNPKYTRLWVSLCRIRWLNWIMWQVLYSVSVKTVVLYGAPFENCCVYKWSPDYSGVTYFMMGWKPYAFGKNHTLNFEILLFSWSGDVE